MWNAVQCIESEGHATSNNDREEARKHRYVLHRDLAVTPTERGQRQELNMPGTLHEA